VTRRNNVTMKIAFVFPGQGSQSVGMLDAFAAEGAVQDALVRAREALGDDLARLIAEGPAEQLALTVNTQPAMLAAGVAIYRAWLAAGGPVPSVMAGHSLGEYSALTAADAMPLEAALRLVRFRAQAMQEAVPAGTGSMAAILGLDDEAVIRVCAEAAQGEIVEAVNFNAPSQVVIAGHAAAVARACEAAKRLGAKRAVPLAVSAPFHSSLLAGAAARLRERLRDEAIGPPRVAVINNVDVTIETEPDRIRDALARQAAAPVRWAETIRAMAAQGVTHVVECGPGRVLAGLTKRIVADLESLSISSPETIAEAVERVRQ
jgi:[acyl-carrier-protein] S-malonyltransferase